jgi:hypothetical protein
VTAPRPWPGISAREWFINSDTPHPAGALHAYRLFFGFLHGHILDELQELIDNPDEIDDLLRLGLHRLPRHQFPHLRALAPNSPATTQPPTSSKAPNS